MKWSELDLRIAGELRVKNGLQKRRISLEKFVAQFVTTRKTDDTILFRGKQHYVRPVDNCPNKNEIAWHFYALECLYQIEAAWKEKNIEKAISAAVAFGRCDDEAWKCHLCKSDSWSALYSRMRKQIVGRHNAAKTNARKAAKRPDFQATVEEGMASGLSYTKAVERAAGIHDCDEKTIRNHVPNPMPRNRGRWKRGRKNIKQLS
jgi:hypothetical protein